MIHNALVVTDLDGTLLSSKGTLSVENRNTLIRLGEMNIARVVATGRSPYSFEKVATVDFPIDYLVFSSGAGILNWSTKELLLESEISALDGQGIINVLVNEGADFMVHEAIPLNHRFLYYDSGNNNPDFHNRISIYENHCSPLAVGVNLQSPITQLVVVLPPEVERFEYLKQKLNGFKIVRVTSPLDGESIWMEIFNSQVSKANATNWLCNQLGINRCEVVAIGNDYNDLDMLNAYPKSYVVENAPTDLKKTFTIVKHNDHSGFSHAIEISGILDH